MQEIWKDIPIYKGTYQASNLGNIRSLYRTITYKTNDGNVHHKFCKGKLLKQRISNTGYFRTPINFNGFKRDISTHRLIAITFLENPNNFPQVNHIDGNRLNNKVENLEWVSMSENVIHAYKTGLNYGLRDELSPHKKAVIQLDKYGKFIKRWCSATQAARELGCHKQGIYQVCIHKKKTCCGYIWKYEDE